MRTLPPANPEALCEQVEAVRVELRAYTWRDLETNGKF